ncbi:hypothetical protein [Paludisphaera soli]|uniref:hypothetical protein n=1 Tax=Paludisphaera soli TaxID=2712865 RepID=UPI0013ECBEC5|nr:hypothetical protein [Paludisphaera soli]
MARQYALRFRHVDPMAILGVLEGTPTFHRNDRGGSDFEARDEENSGGRPDASLRIESYGVRFTDEGGSKRHLGELIVRLVGRFGAVEVAELE